MCSQPCYFGGPFALNLATMATSLLKGQGQGFWRATCRASATLPTSSIGRPTLRLWAAFTLPGLCGEGGQAAMVKGGELMEEGQGLRRHAQTEGQAKSKRR